MRTWRNVLLGVSVLVGWAVIGLTPTAGAAPPPLNSMFVEQYNLTTGALISTQTYGIGSVTQSGGQTAIISTGPPVFNLTINPSNYQPVVAGQYYEDGGSSPNASISGPSCGGSYLDDSSVYVDQASFDSSSQPTTLGLEFDIVCGETNREYVGTAAVNLEPTTPGQGYYIYGDDGSIGGFGNDSFLTYLGDLSVTPLNQPIVGMATTPDGGGYWMAATDGGIFSFGDAEFHGSTGSLHLNKPIVGMAATPDGGGYWLVASDGGIFSFGDAQFHGSTGSLHLNKPIVGMAATPDGGGYWLVASDGGIFAFGDAQFHGSTGALHLNKPIVGMALTPDGRGYWMVATDGGIFSFGDANFFGSTGALHLNQPIVGMSPTRMEAATGWLAPMAGSSRLAVPLSMGVWGGQGITNAVGITR